MHPHLQVNASAFTSFESVYKMSYQNWRWKWAWHHAGKAKQGFAQLVNKTPIPPLPCCSPLVRYPRLWVACQAHPRCGCCPLSPSPLVSLTVGWEMLLSPPWFGGFPADVPVLDKGTFPCLGAFCSLREKHFTARSPQGLPHETTELHGPETQSWPHTSLIFSLCLWPFFTG